MRGVLGVFKPRIGLVIAITALAGMAVSSGPSLSGGQIAVLFFSVLFSSASAGAFNQYYEYDIDPLMRRTRNRVFAAGHMQRGPGWLLAIGGLLALSVIAAGWVLNAWTALYVFLGAFFYAVVYTVWLKRRTWLNIVIGGLAGSWAVLAGAAAVNPQLGAVPLALAFILFLWTPPHFWSLAIACKEDYAAANIPMLPVVVGERRAARMVFEAALMLVAASFLPALLGLGVLYLAAAVAGGGWFVHKAWKLSQNPGRASAMSCFFASLIQLSLLLAATMIEAWL
ncbi:heme o synthase [Denitratisoma oestradiolicum]|uniref:Protoheme IX farnesyltransferase n=1 Tax=Denitratisoma oestradiolicum TaxID=311182 RepID=A0A6S6Y479_9PROT|nr:heme o synthase [Denitratisoma oestradiolicum]CAB1370140.1 Protoheme IX farnesyltransferase 2 [Denitratisoma oestradiolicum]